MLDSNTEKIIIVEGTSDKRKVKSIIKEPIEIICTNGTISISRLDELVDYISGKEVYILVDADDAGEKLRRQFIRELPEVEHLYIDKMYREVASAPEHHLATVLLAANIDVHTEYLES
ncbi:toprim domain-containing protein [Robertmurraya sp. FSL W8-0741]|uniref:toprim domain-containing protein n=1 Tax=Robertmurraya sp. FSL W8-0741 TaxID=2954629 RepID=UPI0030FB1881